MIPDRDLLIACGAIVAAASLPSAARAVSMPGGSTSFVTGNDVGAAAEWDTWTWGDDAGQNAAGASGSQGPAAFTVSNGGVGFTSTDVGTEILADFTNPPGGFLGDPDSFYVHDGAFEWSVEAELSGNVEFLRVSYSLVASDSGGASAFPNAPSTDIASTAIDSRGYTSPDDGNPVFYTDLDLANPSDAFAVTFGDNAIPNTSFRSVDAIRVETFETAPSPVPEPRHFAFAGGLAAAALALLRGRARRKR